MLRFPPLCFPFSLFFLYFLSRSSAALFLGGFSIAREKRQACSCAAKQGGPEKQQQERVKARGKEKKRCRGSPISTTFCPSPFFHFPVAGSFSSQRSDGQARAVRGRYQQRSRENGICRSAAFPVEIQWATLLLLLPPPPFAIALSVAPSSSFASHLSLSLSLSLSPSVRSAETENQKPKTQLPLQARPRDRPGRAQERLRGPGHRRRRRRRDEHAPEERQAGAQGQAGPGARVAVAPGLAGPVRYPAGLAQPGHAAGRPGRPADEALHGRAWGRRWR